MTLAVVTLSLLAPSAGAAERDRETTVAVGVADASPLGSGEIPRWMPRERGELIPLGLGLLLLGGSYAALRRSTGAAYGPRDS